MPSQNGRPSVFFSIYGIIHKATVVAYLMSTFRTREIKKAGKCRPETSIMLERTET